MMESASDSDDRYRVELAATSILLACERHRLKTGDWPGSIEAIDEDILPDPPVDPFSGQAFRMERRDGQLLIYSIGPNRVDEHCEIDWQQWPNGEPDDPGTGAWDIRLRRQPSPPEEALTEEGNDPDQ